MRLISAEEMQAIDQQAIITASQIGQNLFSQGLNEAHISSNLYNTLAGLDQTRTNKIQQAIASMAAALSGGGQRGQPFKVS